MYREAATVKAGGLYFFSKAIWPLMPEHRNLISRRCHLPLCMACEDDSLIRLLIEWPRKHGKSTIATVCRPVQRLARMAVEGEDPCTRFAIYCSSKENAKRHWRDIRNGIDGNELFRFLFPELVPPVGDREWIWNTEEGVVPRTYNPKEPTFDTLGGGKSTSRHYDDITVDDMIDEQNFDSPTAVEMAIEYYRLTRNLLEDEKKRLVIVGNRWSMNDLNYMIHREEPGTAILTASCWGPRMEGKYKCRNLPEPLMELLREMPQGEPLWPERFSKEELGSLLLELKPRIYSAQYLNDPNDPDAVDFRQEWLQYCDLDYDREQGIVVRVEKPDGDELVPLSCCNVYITWDPALDGKTAESENAIVVSAMDHRGRVFILDEYARKCDPLVALDDLLKIAHRWRKWLRASGLEEVLFQKVLGRLLVQRAQEQNIYLGLRTLKTPTGQSKDQRIRAWIGALFEARKVWVRRKCTHFVEQYGYFGVIGAKRDLIDAFAYATQLWSRAASPEEVLQDEEMEEQMKTELGLTGYGSALRRG